jgi:spoIIIJ-associated protein
VFAGKTDNDLKVIVDSENYRTRHEEQLIRMALKSADQVKRSGRSVLLEPMNPFERRLVHTALNDYGVDTKSEGDGLYKQIRITLKQN